MWWFCTSRILKNNLDLGWIFVGPCGPKPLGLVGFNYYGSFGAPKQTQPTFSWWLHEDRISEKMNLANSLTVNTKNMDQLLRWKKNASFPSIVPPTTTWSRIFRSKEIMKWLIFLSRKGEWSAGFCMFFLYLAVDWTGGTWSQDWCGKTGHGNSTFGCPYRYLLLGSSVFGEKNTSHDDVGWPWWVMYGTSKQKISCWSGKRKMTEVWLPLLLAKSAEDFW